MTHVVTENCNGCRYTDCVEACPVECFHADHERTYIDPQVCIDCGACIPACPVQAIYDEFDLPDDQQHWLAVNEERCRELPLLSEREPPLPAAEERKSALGF
jgi:ferredoxin